MNRSASSVISHAPRDQSELQLFDDAFMHKLERLQLLANKLTRGSLRGEHTTSRRGRGLEFADFRPYHPGDDIRHIDWNISSRLDQLFLKLFASEVDITLHLLLDASASMNFGDPLKFDYARRLAAALAVIGLSNFDRVSLTPFDVALGAGLAPMKAKRHIASVLEFLRVCQCQDATNYVEPFTEFCSRTPSPGLVVVITDLLGPDDALNALDALRLGRHEIVLLQVLSEDEIAPSIGGVLKLIDAESNEEIRTTVDAPLRALYQQHLDQFMTQVASYCRRSRIEYIRTSTAIAFEDVVLNYLRRGAHLR